MSRKYIFGIGALVVVLAIIVLIIANFTAVYDWVAGALDFLVNPSRIDPASIVRCSDAPGCATLYPIAFSLVLVLVIITGFAYTTLLERRFVAWFQNRVGPNRVGPKGLLQPLADAIKLIFKEDIIPDEVYRAVYYLAPVLKVVPILLVVAVIPLGPDWLLPWFDGKWYQVPMGIADPNVGVLWLLAIMSIGTYGVVLAGWSSNNKYAMLGGIRASAQMISYELSMGAAIAVPVMLASSMSVGDIISSQKNIWDWYVFQNPLAAAILMIALLAEVSRSPFDLPEAEQELTQGYMTEYSGMKFAIFMMAEYIGMIVVSLIAIAMFFGGYNLFLVDSLPILGPVFFIGKVVVFLIGMVWVRATLPRIRYDRLMQFGWKVMLPLALLSVAWTAIATTVGEAFQSPIAYGIVSGIVFVVVLAVGVLMLRRAGEENPEDELDVDPVITGERGGIGYAVLQLIGGLVAVPFVLIGWTAKFFEGLRRIGEPKEDAIQAQSTAKSPARRSGAK